MKEEDSREIWEIHEMHIKTSHSQSTVLAMDVELELWFELELSLEL